MKDFNDVLPIPMGQKMLVTCNKEERFTTETGLIIPEGAMNVELLDVQTVVEVGLYLKAEANNGQTTIEPGDVVNINFNSPSFWRKKKTTKFADRYDGSGVQDQELGSTMEFVVKMYTIKGEDYILVDKNDLEWVWKADSLKDTEE